MAIDFNGCTEDQQKLAAELRKRGESEEVIEQAVRILHVDFAEKGDLTAYGKNEALINKAMKKLENVLRENDENAEAAAVTFRRFWEVSRQAKAVEMSKDGYL